MWIPKFLKPHAWCCLICKKFEITKYGFRPFWIRRGYYGVNFEHWEWDSKIINNQDFGNYTCCGEVLKTLAKFEGV